MTTIAKRHTFFNNDEETELNSCLVLCIEEHDNSNVNSDDNINDNISIDTRIFISYNEADKMYIINGKRLDLINNVKTDFCQPFMFCAESSNDVLDFLSLILDIKRTFSYTLFNYNNLSYDKNDITYSFMEDNIDRRYEIAAYDHVTYSRKIFRQLVRVTKLMYNKI